MLDYELTYKENDEFAEAINGRGDSIALDSKNLISDFYKNLRSKRKTEPSSLQTLKKLNQSISNPVMVS